MCVWSGAGGRMVGVDEWGVTWGWVGWMGWDGLVSSEQGRRLVPASPAVPTMRSVSPLSGVDYMIPMNGVTM